MTEPSFIPLAYDSCHYLPEQIDNPLPSCKFLDLELMNNMEFILK